MCFPTQMNHPHRNARRGTDTGTRQRDSIDANACIAQLAPLLRHSIEEGGVREDAGWRSSEKLQVLLPHPKLDVVGFCFCFNK